MPSNLGLAGSTPQKQVRFAPIYTGRWSSGIWTNRSPMRDATTNRITEKFYGPAGDALIAGSNVEISNKLTLTRRPGNTQYDSNSYSDVLAFFDFKIFGANGVNTSAAEQIYVMVDEATALYSTFNGTKDLLWTKSSGAGQTSMASVGNTLYFANGVDNKKWLQSLVAWAPNTQWNTSTSQPFTTFFIDPNGNIQQLLPNFIPVTNVEVAANVLTITSTATLTNFLTTGMNVTFPGIMSATFLENQTVTVSAVTTHTFTASLQNANYTGTETNVIAAQTSGGVANPESGTTEPTWSTVVPSASNNFQGGITVDHQISWVNRGNPVENWGIAAPTTSPQIQVGTSAVSWQPNTYYSLVGAIIDSNGNLQQVSTAGTSGISNPAWGVTVGQTTTDGTVVWTMIQTAASMIWQPNTQYQASTVLTLTSVAAGSGGHTVYTGFITNGAANFYAGKLFSVNGFTNIDNNGTYTCTASTTTTLTLNNAAGVVETNNATASTLGSFIIGDASGTPCLFTTAPQNLPALINNVSAYLYDGPTSGPVGSFTLSNPTSTGSALASTTTENSFSFVGTPLSSGSDLAWATVNAAGDIISTNNPFPSFTKNYQLIILGTLNVPVAGQYSFTINHHDGMIWGIGGGAVTVSGTSSDPFNNTATAAEGYPVAGGTNKGLEGGQTTTDKFVMSFPTAGTYPVEIDYSYWYHSGQTLQVTCNGFPLANVTGASTGGSTSGTNQPIWPGWSTSYAPGYPTVTESNGQITWENIGPVTDFTWQATKGFALPNQNIIDPNGYTETPYRSGYSGATIPTFLTGANALTFDNPNLIWINNGIITQPPTGTLSTFNGGWKYYVSLVNTLDDTVSNASPASVSTGNFVGIGGVILFPGTGLPVPSLIDPQADYVAIFRTTDGQAVPFLIPGQTTTWTVPLSQYLQSGYVDVTPDIDLDNEIEAPIAGENTPPAAGASALTVHLGRIWYAVNNVVNFTTGPATPAGNGLNGTSPLNFDVLPSLVKRIVGTSSGALVWTLSDIYIVTGNATDDSPIQPAVAVFPGLGIATYNALDVNGSLIGFFTTDKQFVILDPGGGLSVVAGPIADQLRLNNGNPGTSWNPASVYVAWHTEGEDQAWYLCDGEFGWFRLMATPAPEQGNCWSPFATIVGGVGAIASIEVVPGTHRLLLGPINSETSILYRDLTNWQDKGQNYYANAVIGSAVFCQPGQVANVAFITTESARVGSPIVFGIIVDEALPYYTGPFEILKHWVNDPPNLKPSKSLYNQRFYLSDNEEQAAMRHCQMNIIWQAENALNELLALTVFGAINQEE
jgi:hypothetical protein